MLTNEEKQAVGDWLKLDKKLKAKRCPFEDRICRPCVSICLQWFPDIGIPFYRCPCDAYELTQVSKTARRMVRE